MENFQSLDIPFGTINSEINPLLTVNLVKSVLQDNITYNLTSNEIFEIIDNVIEGVKLGRTREEIIDQIDLLLDKESIIAIKEGRNEIAEGKVKSYSIDEFKKKFNLT